MRECAGILEARGVRRGDTVLIYMPMIPECLVTMLACARLGATHCVVFGGFASRELAVRIAHVKVGLYNEVRLYEISFAYLAKGDRHRLGGH